MGIFWDRRDINAVLLACSLFLFSLPQDQDLRRAEEAESDIFRRYVATLVSEVCKQINWCVCGSQPL